MLDSLAIFTKGGLILFKHDETDIDGQPLSHLIQEVLIQERQGLSQFIVGNYLLKWVLANEYDLVVVGTVLRIGKVNQAAIDDILLSVKETFIDLYKNDLQSTNYQESYTTEFLPSYNKITKIIEQNCLPQGKHLNNNKKEKQLQTTNTNAEKVPTQPEKLQVIDVNQNGPAPEDEDQSDINDDETTTTTPTSVASDAELRLLERLAQRKTNRAQGAASPTAKPKKPANNGKIKTKWSDTKVSKEEAEALDFSEGQGQTGLYNVSERDIESTIQSHGKAPTKGESSYWEVDAKSDADVAIKLKSAQEDALNNKNSVWGYFQGLVGQKELTKEDLDEVSKQFTQRLVNKNVNPEIAEKLVESVVTGLVGKKLGTFNTMYSTIQEMLEESLTRLLTPKKPIDVLTGVALAQKQGRPYSIVFCGVNGVGKSTSLSKVAAFFLAQGLSVGVAACDTFRSGAIEQLKTHCAALNIALYDKGYGRDEASVAADGIQRAKRDGLDVILIDTAGRMQGNDPLMKGLARLMNVNEPDLILFVGEALVGNDGCDQLINFNRALRENSGKQHPRLIDGIVLTKFDTIDDKVGTAINMIYSTGQPIVFVGTGQTYRDLKRPHPKIFIDALLK